MRICVTGATGYIASHIVLELLSKGFSVNATVRSLNSTKAQELIALCKGDVHFFEADLQRDGSFDEALRECTHLIHTASPVIVDQRKLSDPQKELFDPAVEGTKNVLQSAVRFNIKRVVVTSSLSAITVSGKEKGESHVFTEADWNPAPHLMPYGHSKMLAEKLAWEMSKEAPWTLVVINPSVVVGPPLLPSQKGSEAVSFMQIFLEGMAFFTPPLYPGLVSMSDVVDAHIAALHRGEGRYLLNAEVMSWKQIGQLLINDGLDCYPLPRVELPKFVALHLLLALNAGPRELFEQILDWKPKLDGSRAVTLMHHGYRPVEAAIREMAHRCIELGFVAPPRRSRQSSTIVKLQQHQAPFLSVFSKFVEFIATPGYGIWPILFALSALRFTRAAHLELATCNMLLVLGTNCIKDFLQRPRPAAVDLRVKTQKQSQTFSFPSGHVAEAFALSTMAGIALPGRIGLLTVVGLARMYSGSHTLDDVLGGASWGYAVSRAMKVDLDYTNPLQVSAAFVLSPLFLYLYFSRMPSKFRRSQIRSGLSVSLWLGVLAKLYRGSSHCLSFFAGAAALCLEVVGRKSNLWIPRYIGAFLIGYAM